MISDICEAHARLKDALEVFDQTWPAWVEDGVAWRLPLLKTQKTPDVIAVQRLDKQEAIRAARQAYGEFERESGQAPGTVMRLPGYFTVGHSVLEQVIQINQLKDELIARVEQTRLEMNVVKSARPRILRSALGPAFSMMQISRHIQVFDAAPRMMVFTWAGHTAGAEKVRVSDIRELLLTRAQAQAAAERCSVAQTPAGMELRALVNLADDEVLHRYKKLAPHPRVMLWFSEKTRYDAMVHANLPIFVRQGEGFKLRELADFDRSQRQVERPDRKSRISVIPRMNLFLVTKIKPLERGSAQVIENVSSTYKS